MIVGVVSHLSVASVPVRSASPGDTSYTYRLGFDIQKAPTYQQMEYSWNNYAYFYIGVYISGNNRGPQGTYFNPSWVTQVGLIGFGFIPIDVGWQAPDNNLSGQDCGGQAGLNRMSPDPTTAYSQGVQQAVVAAQAARDLGFTGSSPVYLDIEYYDHTVPGCETAVLEFIRGWLIQMKQYEGKVGSAYGSASGSKVQAWASISPPPDDIWFAQWNAVSEQDPNISVWATQYISSSSWRIQPPYGRVHQFRGDIPNVWFGDAFLKIDQNCAWGKVAGNGYSPDSRYPYCPGTPP